MMKNQTGLSGLNIMANFKKIFIFLPVILFIGAHESSGELRRCVVKLHDTNGVEIKLNVEIAANKRDREKGLMFRTSLPQNSGMLFIFENEQRLSFWMKNTYIPLDIAFIDSQGIIKDIYQMTPLDTSVFYNSSTVVKYALEVNQKWFAGNRVTVGSKIGLNGCLGK